MERLEGRTLADELASNGPLGPRRAAEIAASVAEALEFAHRAGVVHRDVKPGNVMLTADGGVKVMDFGIARAISADTVTQTATVLGTAAYLSPEQASGERVDARSDVYSLGAVLYEMVTGRPPFVGDSPLAVAYKHVNEDPIPPSSVSPRVPSALDAVVMRALAKEPAARYASAEEMAADLRRAAGSGLVETEPHTTTAASPATTDVLPASIPATEPLGASPFRRRRWGRGVLLGAAVLVALIAVLAWALLSQGPATTGRPPSSGAGAESAPAGAAPASQPSSTPSEPASGGSSTQPRSVADAVAGFRSVLAGGVASGQIDEKDATDLEHRVDEALAEYQDHGDLEKALEKLADADAKAGELQDKGAIASSQFADSLHASIAGIGTQMQAAPPPEGDGGGNGHGEGNGQGEND
jgi:serine/threonine-protein kinase